MRKCNIYGTHLLAEFCIQSLLMLPKRDNTRRTLVQFIHKCTAAAAADAQFALPNPHNESPRMGPFHQRSLECSSIRIHLHKRARIHKWNRFDIRAPQRHNFFSTARPCTRIIFSYDRLFFLDRALTGAKHY